MFTKKSFLPIFSLCIFTILLCNVQVFANNNSQKQAKAFAVKFMGYKSEWQGMPDLVPYYFDKELATIDHKDFGGTEMYIVRNTFGGETKVYETVLTDAGKLEKTRLLHTYKPGDLMFFTCNVSDLYPNITLRYEAPNGTVYEYSPGISPADGDVVYTPHGEPEKRKEER